MKPNLSEGRGKEQHPSPSLKSKEKFARKAMDESIDFVDESSYYTSFDAKHRRKPILTRRELIPKPEGSIESGGENYYTPFYLRDQKSQTFPQELVTFKIMDNSVDNIDESYYSSYSPIDPGKCDRPQAADEYSFVSDLVNKNKVVVFSKSQCPHCTDSKSLLSNMGVEYTTVELDQISEGPQVQNILGQMTDARTVPRIFIDGQCVGGNSDLQSLGQSGSLEKLLKRM